MVDITSVSFESRLSSHPLEEMVALHFRAMMS